MYNSKMYNKYITFTANAHSEVVPGSEVKPQPAPSIKWTPGQENRHFRGVENGHFNKH